MLIPPTRFSAKPSGFCNAHISSWCMCRGYSEYGEKRISKCSPKRALWWYSLSWGPSLTLSDFLSCWPLHLIDPFHNAELKSHLMCFIRLEMRYFIYLHWSKSLSPTARIATPAPGICIGLLDYLFPAGPGEIFMWKEFCHLILQGSWAECWWH